MARNRNSRLSHLTTDGLEEVPGIGPATLEKIKPFATV
jgi:DNA uptake protein ComE-like DNA-binding protein